MNKLKFIQVNIFKGKYLNDLVGFLKKENPDFVSMQEVTYGWPNLEVNQSINIFEFLKKELGYFGVFVNDATFIDHPDALHGNAVLSRHPISNSQRVVLKAFRPLSDEDFVDSNLFPDWPRSMLDATVDLKGQEIHILSVHGAWTAPPVDTPETLRQAALIAKHLKSIKRPFIMGGDLNTTPNKEVIRLINTAANNLITDSEIKYTTHPTVHKIAPRALLVDYIFASPEFKKISIDAPEVVVSDHLPVVAELDLSR